MTSPAPQAAGSKLAGAYERLVRALVIALAAVGGAGVLGMMLVTCVDVVLRVFQRPLGWTMDVVSAASVVAIAGALPCTTALRGHVAVDFLPRWLKGWRRRALTTATNAAGLALFVVLAWRCWGKGTEMLASGEVTPTLQMPMFWMPWMISVSCAATALVILYDLLRPGREVIRP